MDKPVDVSGVSDRAIFLFSSLDHMDTATLIGAFSGAVIFVLSSEDYSKLYRMILGIVSFTGGIISADFISALVTPVLPHDVTLPQSVAALFSSAGIVRVLLFFSKNSSTIVEKIVEKRE